MRAFLATVVVFTSLIIGCQTVEELDEKAIEMFERGDYEGAVTVLTKRIEKAPTWLAYYRRGCAKEEQGKYQEALEDFNKGIQIEGNHLIFGRRGIVKAKLNDFRGAITDFNSAIELNPNDTNSYHERGVSKAMLQDHRGAIIDYNKCVELGLKEARLSYNRSVAKAALGEYDSAIDDLNQSIKINPLAEAYFARGIILLELDRLEEEARPKSFDERIDAEQRQYRGLKPKRTYGPRHNSACLDLSKAGELGYEEAYVKIKEYCN